MPNARFGLTSNKGGNSGLKGKLEIKPSSMQEVLLAVRRGVDGDLDGPNSTFLSGPLLSPVPPARGPRDRQGGRVLCRVLARLAKTDLLLVDEWGLAPLTIADARELLEVIDDRCTTRSTLIASQLPGDAWHGTIPDPSLADALLDRIVHTAHKIALRGESMPKLRAKKVS